MSYYTLVFRLLSTVIGVMTDTTKERSGRLKDIAKLRTKNHGCSALISIIKLDYYLCNY
jgi:hypothetical protein